MCNVQSIDNLHNMMTEQLISSENPESKRFYNNVKKINYSLYPHNPRIDIVAELNDKLPPYIVECF